MSKKSRKARSRTTITRTRSRKTNTRNSRPWLRNEGKFDVVRSPTTALRRQRPSRRLASSLNPVRPVAMRGETLTERAYRLIEEQIVTLQLKPGDNLLLDQPIGPLGKRF